MICVLYFLVFGFFSGVTLSAQPHKYAEELYAVTHRAESVLVRTMAIDNLAALRVVRKAQWESFLMETQQRRSTYKDRVGYYIMETQCESFANKAYVLMPAEVPLLYGLISQYARKMGIAVPTIVFIDDPKLCDANSANWDKNSGFLVIGRGAFEQCSEAEFSGLVGYHLGHLAKRTHARLIKYFTPAAVCGVLAALYGISKINVEERGMASSSVLAISSFGACGIGLCLVWCYLMRYSQLAADRELANIDPTLGFALLGVLERGQTEDYGGDALMAMQIVEQLPAIDPVDREKLTAQLKVLNNGGDAVLAFKQIIDSGLLGTQYSLEDRRAFFTQASLIV